MLRISDESYERVTEILEDIGYACETSDYYEDWEDVARSSFCIMDKNEGLVFAQGNNSWGEFL